jgi:hypothetical protein
MSETQQVVVDRLGRVRGREVGVLSRCSPVDVQVLIVLEAGSNEMTLGIEVLGYVWLQEHTWV